MTEKVLIDDLESSDIDFFLDVTYYGVPFTGLALDKSDGYTQYHYLNGKGHGRCFSRCSNGQPEDEFFSTSGRRGRCLCSVWRAIKVVPAPVYYPDGGVSYSLTIAQRA